MIAHVHPTTSDDDATVLGELVIEDRGDGVCDVVDFGLALAGDEQANVSGHAGAAYVAQDGVDGIAGLERFL